ncbi:hypothetical protein EIP86_002499 [Pleurotus ostreatoroseus]|nr:hypothetical protein EIP86_002499 [Pleurotus ostreatoroseus]
MCIGFWSLEHPDYALILCSNRDEYLARPTTPAHWHAFEMPVERDPYAAVPEHGPPRAVSPSASASTVTDASESHSDAASDPGPAAAGVPRGSVLSGRDLRAGGTWLGISRAGRVAFLTNITEDSGPFASTRGALTSSFLLPDPALPHSETPETYAEHLVRAGGSYAGFNLLLLAPSPSRSSSSLSPEGTGGLTYDAAFVTNHGGGLPLATRGLSPAERRCGALSNGVDGRGADAWPKVRQGTALFADVLAELGMDVRSDADVVGTTSPRPATAASTKPKTADEADEMRLVERLFALLTWHPPTPPRARADLKHTIQIPPLRIRADASAAAKGGPPPVYGTRAATALLVRRDGRALFVERDVWVLDERGEAVRGEVGRQRVVRFDVEVELDGNAAGAGDGDGGR